MTDSHPFFRFVWRVNALAILAIVLLGGLSAAALVGYELWSLLRYRPVIADVAPAPSDQEADRPGARPKFDTRIGVFQPVGDVYFASLIRVPRGEEASFRVSSYKKTYDSTALNLVFFDPAKGESKRLLPDDNGLILSQTALRDSDEATGRIRALLLTYVAADTDGDKLLSDGDAKRVILVRPNGAAMITLAEAVDALDATWRVPGASTLRYFTRVADEVRYAEVDLDSFEIKPGQTVVLPKL